jgi:hypothetical protein
MLTTWEHLKNANSGKSGSYNSHGPIVIRGKFSNRMFGCATPMLVVDGMHHALALLAIFSC